MNPLNWLRSTAAQALDLAAEAYGSLAGWCVRTSEQLDPYTENDYQHARHLIDQAAQRYAQENQPLHGWTPPGFPRAELRDADHIEFATGGLVHPDGTRIDYDGWHHTGPDGRGINIGRPSGGSREGRGPSYWLDDALKGDPTTWQADRSSINMDESGWHYIAPDGSRINVGPPDNPAYADGAFPSYWFNESDWQPRTPSDGQEHRYDEACGGCTCGWPTGKHPSETGDE